MARVHAVVGIAVCLVAILIGCKTNELGGILAVSQSATSQTVNGNLSVVALNTKQSLESTLKVSAEVSQDGPDTYYVSSKTKNGARFKLVLTRDRTGATEKTNMRLEWQDQRDSTFGLHLLADLTGKTG